MRGAIHFSPWGTREAPRPSAHVDYTGQCPVSAAKACGLREGLEQGLPFGEEPGEPTEHTLQNPRLRGLLPSQQVPLRKHPGAPRIASLGLKGVQRPLWH